MHLLQDQGSGAARNAGLKVSRGRYIAFQDDTCLPHPNRFASQLHYLKQSPYIDLVFSCLTWMDSWQNIYRPSPSLVARGEFPAYPHQVFKLLYLGGNQVPTSTIMFRRELLNKYGDYPQKPLGCEEWLLLLKWAA